MLQNRDILAANLKWCIGDGLTCDVYFQPWFRLWRNIPSPSPHQRQLKVAHLFNPNNLTWNWELLTQLGGPQLALDIANEHCNLVLRTGIRDKLMFTWARNGDFSVKRAYQMVFDLRPRTDIIQSDSEKLIWQKVWKTKEVLPKIRSFMWKAISGALPSAMALSRCIPAIPKACALCGYETEDTEHILFHCPHARLTWFQSTLGFRADAVFGRPIKDILLEMWQPLDQAQTATSFTIAWHIWKARCSSIFEAKRAKPNVTLATVESLIQAVRISKFPSPQAQLETQSHQRRPSIPLDSTFHYCYLDGSFKHLEGGGAAYQIFYQEEMIRYEITYKSDADSAFQMEAWALLSALQAATAMGIRNCVFRTDSKLLADTFRFGKRFQEMEAADWRAYITLSQIANLLALNRSYICEHIPREENGRANQLAIMARVHRMSYYGCTFPLFHEDNSTAHSTY